MRLFDVDFFNIPTPAEETSKFFYENTLLVEPNLVIPGKKPIGPVTIDWDHPLTKGLRFCSLWTTGSAADPIPLYSELGDITYTSATGRNYKAGALSSSNSTNVNGSASFADLNMYPAFHGITVIGGSITNTDIGIAGCLPTDPSRPQIWLDTNGGNLYMGLFNCAIIYSGAVIIPSGTPSWDFSIAYALEADIGIGCYVNGIKRVNTTNPGATDFSAASVQALGAHSKYGLQGSNNTRVYFSALFSGFANDNILQELSTNPYQFLIPA